MSPYIESRVDAVRDILRGWDPIGVPLRVYDEYDSYASGVLRLLDEGADELELRGHLEQLGHIEMGLSALDEAALDHAVAQLLQLDR